MTAIKVGEAFTINQISDGFTLDTSDFPDLLDDDEQFNHNKTVELSNQEIQRLLNVEDGTENSENAAAVHAPFVVNGFNDIKPTMNSIFGDGKVLKLIKKDGTGGVVPPEAQVTVEYVGYFEYQDEPFDSTLFQRDKQSIFHLGRGEIIKGLEIAIASMKKCETAVFIVQPDLAYGELGCPPRIPGNAEVFFKVEIIDFLDNGSADRYNQLTDEDKRKFPAIEKIVHDLLITARNSCKRQNVKQAIREYSRAAHYLDTAILENDEEKDKMNEQLSRALSNLIICYNQMKKPKLARASFERLPKKTAKAYYNYGKALKQLGEYDKCMKALQTANNSLPNNDDICREIKEVDKIRKSYQEEAKQFAQNCLKLTAGKSKTGEFEACAREICESFKNNASVSKQELPIHGLTADEIKSIERAAASYGFSITTQQTLGTSKLYLTKK